MDINDKYYDLLSRCRFISKYDTGIYSWCKMDEMILLTYQNDTKIDSYILTFNVSSSGIKQRIAYLANFYIYDEHNIEISNFTLSEYFNEIRILKLKQIFK